MTRAFAEEIAGWRYPPPYSIYGYSEEERNEAVDSLAHEKNHFYAVLAGSELIGFRSFGADGRVAGGDYDEQFLDTGGGLRPDLTGKGLGSEIIEKGLWFGSRTFGTNRFRVTIADFNLRAQKACEQVGFRASTRFVRPGDGKPFTIYTIELTDAEFVCPRKLKENPCIP